MNVLVADMSVIGRQILDATWTLHLCYTNLLNKNIYDSKNDCKIK